MIYTLERNVHDGGALGALQGQEDGPSKEKDVEDGGVRGAVAKEQLRFGWPMLQIDILRQCIAIAEALPGKNISNTYKCIYNIKWSFLFPYLWETYAIVFVLLDRLRCCSLLYDCFIEKLVPVYL